MVPSRIGIAGNEITDKLNNFYTFPHQKFLLIYYLFIVHFYVIPGNLNFPYHPIMLSGIEVFCQSSFVVHGLSLSRYLLSFNSSPLYTLYTEKYVCNFIIFSFFALLFPIIENYSCLNNVLLVNFLPIFPFFLCYLFYF